MKTIIAIILSTVILCVGCTEIKQTARKEAEQELALPTVLTMADYEGLSTQKHGWGFKKNKNAPPDILKEQNEMLERYGAVYLDNTDKKVLYLTFDEGYENGYTAVILDVLKKHEIPAAFFVTAPYLKKEVDLVNRMVEEGHIVGNHSVHHPSLPEVTELDKFEAELLDLDKEFKERYGQNMKYLRPPRGEYSERSLAMSRDLGYTNVFWSFAYADWDTKKQQGIEYAYKKIMDGIHNGCIILLHAVSKDNANILDRVITDLKAQGYTFRSLDELGK